MFGEENHSFFCVYFSLVYQSHYCCLTPSQMIYIYINYCDCSFIISLGFISFQCLFPEFFVSLFLLSLHMWLIALLKRSEATLMVLWACLHILVAFHRVYLGVCYICCKSGPQPCIGYVDLWLSQRTDTSCYHFISGYTLQFAIYHVHRPRVSPRVLS
jgi:hypothetical protein